MTKDELLKIPAEKQVAYLKEAIEGLSNEEQQKFKERFDLLEGSIIATLDRSRKTLAESRTYRLELEMRQKMEMYKLILFSIIALLCLIATVIVAFLLVKW